MGFGHYNRARAFSGKDVPQAAIGRERIVEKLWRKLFSDPSQWWDNRNGKINPRYPDFKHKKTEESLWQDGKLNPPWVQEELASLAPGALQQAPFTWTRRIAKLVKSHQYEKAMQLFQQMQQEGMTPDKYTVIPLLNACSGLRALQEGRCIHAKIIKLGYESDVYVGNALVDMYAKCGSIEDASKIFNIMPTKDVVSWNAMICGYVKCQEGRKALELFQQMQRHEITPDSVTFVGVVNACASLRALEEGRHVHKQIILRGFRSDVFIGNTLIDMYSKCGDIEEAWEVFENMSTRNVVAWSSMILAYVKCGEGQKALELSRQMQREGVEPNPVTFIGMLNACASIAALEEGRIVHAQIIDRGYESDIFVGNCLVDMYAKCGSLEDAWRVFNKKPTRDVVAWNSMIRGYVKCGEGQKAVELFQQMQCEGIDPDSMTFVAVLNGCADVAALEGGRHVHAWVIRSGYESDDFVRSSLVDMYAKCGSIEDAWRVFSEMPSRNVVTWNSMILGYSKCGEGLKALELSQQMQRDGVGPDPCSFVGMLNACAGLGALEEGRRVHEQIIRRGVESDAYVGSALVDMYSKCGSIEDAQRVFNKMGKRDVVAWSAIILGSVKSGDGQKALELSRQMFVDGVDPDPAVFIAVLNVCATVAALDEGRRVHKQIIERGFASSVSVGNCLVDMYGKCGSIEDAVGVFENMPTRDIVSWNAMLAGYGKHGYVREALEHFEQMCRGGEEINEVTFISLLSACSHGGLVDEGQHYFEFMSAICGISPTVEHYACVTDLLGRAGRLHEVEDLIKSMLCEPDATVWMSLVGGCRVHGNMDIGKKFARRGLVSDPENSAEYVLLSNVYGAGRNWGGNCQSGQVGKGRGETARTQLDWGEQ